MTAALLWLLATVLLAAALPAGWAQLNLVDRQGYSALAERAAANRDLQAATANELTKQVGLLGFEVDPAAVGRIAAAYTTSSRFPGQFALANGYAHRWLFTDSVGSEVDPQGRWVIDFAPMLADASFAQTLTDYNVTVPSSVPIPLTDNAPSLLRPGALASVGHWEPRVSVGLALLTAATALLMLIVTPNRSKALVALGVSALLVGAAGWGAMEFARRYVDAALDNTSGNARPIAEAMVQIVRDSMHQWLTVTLIVGGGLVLVGVIVSLLTSLIDPKRGAGTRRPAPT